MTTLVLDNSVILKWFSPEQGVGTTKAQRILRQLIDQEVVVVEPDLMLVELGNALLVGKQLKPDVVNDAIDACLEYGVDVRPCGDDVVKQAVFLAHRHKLAVYDALYLAVTEQVDGILVSDDEKHHGRIKSRRVVMLSEWGG